MTPRLSSLYAAFVAAPSHPRPSLDALARALAAPRVPSFAANGAGACDVLSDATAAFARELVAPARTTRPARAR